MLLPSGPDTVQRSCRAGPDLDKPITTSILLHMVMDARWEIKASRRKRSHRKTPYDKMFSCKLNWGLNMTDQSKPPHEHLYDVPIEQLELSVFAIKALKKTGMTTVGDCVDFYVRGADAMISACHDFFIATAREVQEKMKEHGYWSYVESE